MKNVSAATQLEGVVEAVMSLGLGDGAVVCTYGAREGAVIRPGLSKTTGGTLRRAPTLLDEALLLVQPDYLRHITKELLDEARVASWSSIRPRAGELGPLFDDEVHFPCGIADYVRTYVVKGDEVLGLVAVCRSDGPCFSKGEVRRFQCALPGLARMMARAVDLQRGVDGEALLIGMDGRLLHGTHDALSLLDHLGDREQIASWLADHARAAPASVDLGEVTFTLRLLAGEMGRAVLAVPKAPAPVRVSPLELLSARQREVAFRVAGGGSLREIASSLQVRPETVRSHLRSIYAKLAISSRAEMTQMVERLGEFRETEPIKSGGL